MSGPLGELNFWNRLCKPGFPQPLAVINSKETAALASASNHGQLGQFENALFYLYR